MDVGTTLVADWSPAGLHGQEFYPHETDPVLNRTDFDSSENVNQAANPAFKAELGTLMQVLRQQFGMQASTQELSEFPARRSRLRDGGALHPK
jgi:hypothetical protein|eukprot:COSAG06_NODE_24874_length_650_cov_1.030853_1_plen_93_part_00